MTRRLMWLTVWTLAGTWIVRGVVALYFIGFLPRVEVVVNQNTIHHFNYGFLMVIVSAFTLITLTSPSKWTWRILSALMGFGTGMVIDESIMAVDRQSHYWHWGWWYGPVGASLLLVGAVIWLGLFERGRTDRNDAHE